MLLLSLKRIGVLNINTIPTTRMIAPLETVQTKEPLYPDYLRQYIETSPIKSLTSVSALRP
jgi:hypothetical protein